MKRLMLAALLATTPALAPALAKEPAPPAGLTLDRVVLLMRHGVRPPTKSPPMPAGTARQAWPSWPVAPGYLTPRGGRAVALVAASDRARWIAAGLLPRTGCAGVRVIADSDQRTIETGRIYAGALAPGCTVEMIHKPQDVADPIFSAIDEKAVPFDADVARRAVLDGAGPGGIAGEEARARPLLTRLDTILCGGTVKTGTGSCGLSAEPSALAPPASGKRPKLAGALDRASTAAQILLLEYADGKPMAEVGWGRATPADIERLSALHSTEFRLLARPAYMARANLALIAPIIADAATGTKAPAVTMIAGHDTNIAALGGLLDLHWRVPGLATDDPSPGGAIIFERLLDAKGNAYVRALYRSQSIAQIRALTPLTGVTPYITVLPIKGCTALGVTGLCTADAFRRVMGG